MIVNKLVVSVCVVGVGVYFASLLLQATSPDSKSTNREARQSEFTIPTWGNGRRETIVQTDFPAQRQAGSQSSAAPNAGQKQSPGDRGHGAQSSVWNAAPDRSGNSKFTMPASVARQCEDENGKVRSFCAGSYELVAQFSAEQRDDAWATASEALIVRELTRAEYGPQAVESVECRVTLCLAAVAAAGFMRYGNEIANRSLVIDSRERLDSIDGKGPVGQTFITVNVLHRKCGPSWKDICSGVPKP
jgi:hypothetical protein